MNKKYISRVIRTGFFAITIGLGFSMADKVEALSDAQKQVEYTEGVRDQISQEWENTMIEMEELQKQLELEQGKSRELELHKKELEEKNSSLKKENEKLGKNIADFKAKKEAEAKVQKVEPKQKQQATSSEVGAVSKEERHLLAQLVNHEARGESFEGKKAVVNVVLNRKASSKFPNSIHEIIFQKNQFSHASQIPSRVPTADDIKAVEMALSGSDNTGGALFFWNRSIAKSRWLEGRTVVAVHGQHEFLK